MHIMVAGPLTGEKARGVGIMRMVMRKFIFLPLLFGVLVFGVAQAGEAPDMTAFVRDSRAMVKVFAGKLQGALKAAIKEGGPVHAIPVCNSTAPQIAQDSAASEAWTIGRTSHRLRNAGNAPDPWETAVLSEFQQRAQAGEDLKTMEKTALRQINGQQTLRYMKAIPVGKVCLNCHGSDIAPEVQRQIGELYPSDQATGFKLGELRGAFTITKTLGD